MLRARPFFVLLMTWMVAAPLYSKPIPKRIENQIKTKVIPAYYRQDWASNKKLLSNWVEKLDESELDQIDVILDEQGIPTIGELMLDAQIAQLLSGAALAQTSPHELTRSMPVLSDRVNEVVERINESDFLGEELPDYESIEDYRDVFWRIHVAKNELNTAARSARYAQKILEQATEKKGRGLSDTEQANLDIDFRKQETLVSQVINDLDEAKVEVQIKALDKAAQVLNSTEDYKERLQAAYVIEFYADPVLASLKNSNASYSRPQLQDATLLNTVESNVKYARESAGDLTMHARLLYLGMHWWMRGRYGQGPDGMGLLKSVHALRSAEAQFPLYMPVREPEPTPPNPSNYHSESMPKFDRRHHYIWMYEYRAEQIQSKTESRTENFGGSQVTSVTKFDTFY